MSECALRGPVCCFASHDMYAASNWVRLNFQGVKLEHLDCFIRAADSAIVAHTPTCRLFEGTFPLQAQLAKDLQAILQLPDSLQLLGTALGRPDVLQ